jgi:hypothetical protein
MVKSLLEFPHLTPSLMKNTSVLCPLECAILANWKHLAAASLSSLLKTNKKFATVFLLNFEINGSYALAAWFHAIERLSPVGAI